ncbi:MAG: tRNA (guanosine(46)-N7)-methyltransferase TrmB [Verrucomicrobiota bacterium]
MSQRRVRHHVNPFGVHYLQRAVERLDLPTDREIDVELGCADARFLFELARQFPLRLHLGLEIRQPMVEQVNEEASAEGLTNLRALFAHINIDFDRMFPDHSVHRIYINFPDPWFKTRHKKRRLVNEELVEVLHRKLRPDGELFFQSDIFDFALDAMDCIEQSPLFVNADEPWHFRRPNPYPARSLREFFCDRDGVRVWRMLYRPVPNT